MGKDLCLSLYLRIIQLKNSEKQATQSSEFSIFMMVFVFCQFSFIARAQWIKHNDWYRVWLLRHFIWLLWHFLFIASSIEWFRRRNKPWKRVLAVTEMEKAEEGATQWTIFHQKDNCKGRACQHWLQPQGVWKQPLRDEETGDFVGCFSSAVLRRE